MPIATVNDKRILFVHIPKTAGMAIAEFLQSTAAISFEDKVKIDGRQLRARHLHATAYERLFQDGSFDWAFTIVRHPVSKMLSEYAYQTRKTGLHIQNFMPFSVWLRYSLTRQLWSPGYRDNHFRSQEEFLCFDCEVFRLEDGLQRVAEAFRVHAGLAAVPSIEQHNRSPKREIEVTAADLDLIWKRYRVDFIRFGYELANH